MLTWASSPRSFAIQLVDCCRDPAWNCFRVYGLVLVFEHDLFFTPTANNVCSLSHWCFAYFNPYFAGLA